MKKSKRGMSHTAKYVVEQYELDTRGKLSFITDRVREALVAHEVLLVMMARYDTESTRVTPDDYVDAFIEASKFLGVGDWAVGDSPCIKEKS